jgi:hypothetical protein
VDRIKRLTDLQMAIMGVLWQQGEATVTQVHTALQDERDLAATSVATLLSRLEKYGVIIHRTSGRAQSFAVQDLGLLTVSTSQAGGGYARVGGLVEYFIVPAVESPEPLPENPAAVTQMESLVEEIERLAES